MLVVGSGAYVNILSGGEHYDDESNKLKNNKIQESQLVNDGRHEEYPHPERREDAVDEPYRNILDLFYKVQLLFAH